MRELDAILGAWQGLEASDADAVIATVVHVTGSAYRRPGARMLIGPNGQRVGSISGGCLEGEIVRRAWWNTEGVGPVVHAYDTTSDDDGTWEFGLGCNGVVHIMLERTRSAGTRDMLQRLAVHRATGTPVAVATVIKVGEDGDVCVGDRLLLPEGHAPEGVLAGSSLRARVLARARDVLVSQTGCLAHLDEAEVLVEWVGPPLSLVIFGCGDDALPLVALGKQLGWYVTVADGRPAYARRDRFGEADRVVLLSAGDLLRGLDIHPACAVVMMTHNYPLDARLLPLVLARRPCYLGLLGPRSRAAQLFETLGLAVPEHVHAPIGLDIGGDTQATTALSIAAEIQAATHRREGGKLRLREGNIHEPVVEVGARVRGRHQVTSRPSYCETVQGSHA